MQPLLDQLLRQAVRQFDWGSIYDYDHSRFLTHPPHLDLAVILFPPTGDPVFGNVLLSPTCSQGHPVTIHPETLQTSGIHWRQDVGTWDESQIPEIAPTLWDPGQTTIDFTSPYPASVLKLMVGIGILRLVDAGQITLHEVWEYDGDPTEIGRDFESHPIQIWLEMMLCLSDDRATCALILLLHQHGILTPEGTPPDHALNRLFQTLGLTTLQLNDTRPSDGSFLNRAGSGVGHIYMTAWDSVRLLWLLDPSAPPPHWLGSEGQTVHPDQLLSPGSRRHLVERLMAQQGFHEMLSTSILCGFPTISPGIPSLVPDRWIAADGSVTLQDNQDLQFYSRDVRPCNDKAEVIFAHKTGLTANYGSNIGIVRGIPERGHHRHYLIALFSNLGYRYTSTHQPGDRAYASGFERLVWYPQQISALGSRLDQGIQNLLGS